MPGSKVLERTEAPSKVVADSDPANRPDGRNLRAARNRQLIARACLQLLEEGDFQPTAQRIAKKSGVSTSTIFRLYEDLEAIHCAVLQSRFEQLKDLLVDIPDDLPTAAKIKQLVDVRAKFFEKVAPVRRFLVTHRASSEFAAKALAMNERFFFDQLQKLFAVEVSQLTNADELFYSIDNLMSWENWERLRSIQGLSVNKAKGVTRATLTQLLRS